METIKIVSGVVDSERLTLIVDDGQQIEIMQGDERLRKILDFIVVPITENGEVDLPLTMLDKATADPMPFAEFQEATENKVSFFRVAKKTVAGWIRSLTGTKEAADIRAESVSHEEDALSDAVPAQRIEKKTSAEQKMAAIDEILSKAVPATDPNFHSDKVERQKPVHEDGHTPNDQVSSDFVERLVDDTTKTETIVAVIDGEMIPGMEMIETQFKHALKYGSPTGILNFLKRLGAVIERRGHTIDDVLRFLQRGDMRVADDGSIIALKALKLAKNRNKKSDVEDAPDDQFVDCHSGNVLQWVGSSVQMREQLVDHNRGQECSNGLHIARRGYLTGSGFSGDVCVLVLLAPEDVIAVPHYDANKVRACRYHIVAKLTPEMFSLIKQNKPISDCPEGKILLANVTKGNHIKVTHITQIGSGHGGDLKITKVAEKIEAVELDQTIEVEGLVENINPAEVIDKPVLITDVRETVNLSRKGQAQALYTQWGDTNWDMNAPVYHELLAFKKTSKISWEKLGLPSSSNGNVLPGPVVMGVDLAAPGADQTVVAGPDAHQQLVDVVTKAAATLTKPVKAKSKPKKKQSSPKKPAKSMGSPVVTPAPEKPVKAKKAPSAPTPKVEAKKPSGGPTALIAGLIAEGPITIGRAKAILAIKKGAKKSWEALGVDQTKAAEIVRQAETKLPPII